MQIVATILSEILVLPYIGWGIFMLRKRYRYHDDLPVMLEVSTIMLLVCFYFLEWRLLRVWADRESLLYLFSLGGLFLSGLALYGHVLVSLLSRFVVDLVLDADDSSTHTPRFGPAEALERQDDFSGALGEYLVLAKTFPRHPAVFARAAENMIRLSRYEEAADWLKRAATLAISSRDALAHSVRLAELQSRYRKDAAAAREAMESFLARFPKSPEAAIAQEHLDLRRVEIAEPPPPAELDSLLDNPVDALSPYLDAPFSPLSAGSEVALSPPSKGDIGGCRTEPLSPKDRERQTLSLESMDEAAPLDQAAQVDEVIPDKSGSAASFGIEAIDAPLPDTDSDPAPGNGRGSRSLGRLGELEPLDTSPPIHERDKE